MVDYRNIYRTISCLDFRSKIDVYNFFDSKINNKVGFYSVAINAEKLIRCSEDQSFSSIVSNSIMPVPDGIGAIMLLKRNGFNANKIDLPLCSLEYANLNNLSIGIIGSDKINNQLACQKINARYQNIKISLSIDGYQSKKFIKSTLLNNKIDLLLLGMGSPKQEFFSAEISKLLPELVIINCGGAIDVLSGKLPKAPVWVQKFNVEWLFRLILQPKRFFRYLKLIKFLKIYLE